MYPWHGCRWPLLHRLLTLALALAWELSWARWSAWNGWTLLAFTVGALGVKALGQGACMPSRPHATRNGLLLMGAGLTLLGREDES